jgi:hypothetical protein
MSDPALIASTENFGDALVQELNEAKSGQHLTGTLPISISGNAATASKLQQAITLQLTGDITGSSTFDASANVSIAATLSATGVSPGAYNTATQISPLTVNAQGRIVSVGAPITIAPNWSSIQNKPTTFAAFGITDVAKNGANSDITSITGLTTPLSATQGGTGLNSYVTGDLIVAGSTTTLSRLAAAGSGNVLLSTSAGNIPAWGKMDLTTHVSGSLPVANGGTGANNISAARVNLGLQIGVNVQAWNTRLDSIASLAGASGFLKKDSTNVYVLDNTTYMPIDGGVFIGGVTAGNSIGPVGQTSGLVSKFEIKSTGAANAAFMTFNRLGDYAVYFGLDTDNKLKVGGYSLGANAYEIWHAGTFNPASKLDNGDTSVMQYTGWITAPGNDANALSSGNRTGFTYANNAPFNGPIVNFQAGGYDLQLNATYIGGTNLSFRTRNGDNGTWNGWNSVWHSANFNPATKLDSGATAVNSSALNGQAAAFYTDIAARLGFTPYNSTNPSGYQTAAQVLTTIGSNNALSATRLAAARTINGVAFDGSANITIPTTDATKLPLIGGNLTGALSINGVEVGYRNIPGISTTGGTAGVVARGSCYETTGNITVPSGVFSNGDTITIDNVGSGNISVIQGSGLTMFLAGGTVSGNRTLAVNGLCTIRFRSASVCVISGGGLT